MGMKKKQTMQVMWILKALLACYLVTGILLLLLAFLLYRFDLSEQVVTVTIVAVYAISTFVGGIIAGKIRQEKKFFWGLLIGSMYFLLLIMISFGVYRQVEHGNLLTTALLCVGGGMLGGMLS